MDGFCEMFHYPHPVRIKSIYSTVSSGENETVRSTTRRCIIGW